MMKKITVSSLALIGMLSSALTFAADSKLSSFYSSMHPKPQLAAKAGLHPATDVTVVNASTSYIYATVRDQYNNLVINDVLYPNQNDHLYSDDPYAFSYNTLILNDPYYNSFYVNHPCRYALITVYGTPGNYRITNACN